MGEHDVVKASQRPWFASDVASMAASLGVSPGDTLVVHTRMSAMGWVCGGPQAVVEGLLAALGEAGTLVMPAHSGANSDPALWCNPPVPEEWWEPIRLNMPAFSEKRTPTRGVGCVAELFRSWPGTLRSSHPSGSFSARGTNAGFITKGSSLDFPFGDGSPLARVFDLDGKVLLIGVGYGNNTSMHLGEYRSGSLPAIRQGAAVMAGNGRRWAWYQDIDSDPDLFPAIGGEFEKAGGAVTKGNICQAPSMLMRQRDIVSFTADFLRKRRTCRTSR